MDQSQKKSGIFGLSGLLRNSIGLGQWATSPTKAESSPRKTEAVEPTPIPRITYNGASVESPVKRASESQLAARKIINRPQGPSSKLAQNLDATDFTKLSPSTSKSQSFSGMATSTPRRMPGDNPNKASSFSSSTASYTPLNNPRTTNFTGAATTPRNLFRSSAALYQKPGLPTFSPRVRANTATQSFPPNTPGRTSRGSTADANGRGLSQTMSTELFQMRIPSPPRHLTGEALAKEMPENHNKAGSIYADEFLAHYCPPDFDEQQRRQFFCILDLRRLKYAADEVFTKRDWKINILNFAKEYEKSRSLIMLRYGLYEFKTVRASETVKKEWKQKHGIVDSEDEATPASSQKTVGGGSKRKAEEELTPADTTLTASSTNLMNKRSRAEATPVPATKTKRKADLMDEPDENQPAKLPKSAAPTPQKTPSATKSMFESIANNTQSSTTPKSSSLFSSTTGSKLSNGTQSRSIFESASKAPATTVNPFGHLSDTSKGSGNDDADAESGDETSSEVGEEIESDAQGARQSKEPSLAASVGVSTPQFGLFGTTEKTNGGSSASSDAGSTASRSIFDRITRGSDGQPVRQLSAQPETKASLFSTSFDKDRPASPAIAPAPAKEQAPIPTNNTWSTSTPIKFSSTGATGSSLTGFPAPAAIGFGAAKKTEAPAATPAETPKAAETEPKKAEAAAAPSQEPPKAPAASSALNFLPPTTDASKPVTFSMFTSTSGSSTTAAPTTGTPLFASSVFGQPKKTEEAKDVAKDAAKDGAKDSTTAAPAAFSSLFAAKPAASTPAPAADAPKPSVFQSSTLFGKQEQTETPKASQPAASSLFGKPTTSESQTPAAPASSLFASTAAKPTTNNLFGGSTFGASSTPAPKRAAEGDEPAAKKPAFGSSDTKPGASLFGFGSSTPAGEAAKPAASTSASFTFGSTSTPTSSTTQETKPLFGSSSASQETKPLFGSTPAQADATKSTNIFGSSATTSTPASTAPIFSFGSAQLPATTSQPATTPAVAPAAAPLFGGAGSSFTFSAAGSDASKINNPFSFGGSTSAPSSFNFGSGGTNESGSQSTSTPFAFGNSNATPAPTISFGGASGNSTPAATTGSMFSFGGVSSSQPNGTSMFSQNPLPATSIFGSTLAPGGGNSTGTNSPFTFGGASSLATTPATGTPEPGAGPEEGQKTEADGEEAPQEQISLTEGGPGEEDEVVVHEVRAKAVKLVVGGDSDDDSKSEKEKDKKGGKNPWKVQGVGPLRILKHKTTGAVRMLLRAEPRGHIALNKAVLPQFNYKVEPSGGKYVKLTTATDDGKGLETWMLQVKTAKLAEELAEALEANKKANSKTE
ncbi:nucleoporin nup61 [Diplogelasinospora grovesii]|uniref:Nucleoporin nup61 n=1 Tax=Diplogelasinospora grovesii TaxID=303347 RepID=A0AAN6S9G1_9PEZI|nr:nucleoporin nup61 [Diplogelasinospora grovesii]